MNSKTLALAASLPLLVAANAALAEGTSAQQMMQKMEMMEKMDMMERMDMAEQLDAAKACADQYDFKCANTRLKLAAKLSHDAADQRRYSAAYDYVQQQVASHNEALRLAEEKKARQEQARQEQELAAARQRATYAGYSSAPGYSSGYSAGSSYSSSSSYNANAASFNSNLRYESQMSSQAIQQNINRDFDRVIRDSYRH